MAETEFLKIVDAKNALKGSFKGAVIHAGDLKSGTKNGKDWIKKIFTIQDDSATVDLVAWDSEVTNFKVGYVYEIVNPWWKVYEGNASVQVGKYGTAKVIGSANAGDTMVNEKDTQSVPSEHISTESSLTKLPDTPPVPKEQTVTPPTTATKEELELLDAGTIKVIERESILLYKIRTNVEQTIKKFENDPHGGMVGQFTELIYKKYFSEKK